jgi:MFS family permease
LRLLRGNGAYISAFAMNTSLGAGTMAVTYRATSMGAAPLDLGLLALLAAAAYVLACFCLGRLSDIWGRRTSILAGAALNAAALGSAVMVSRMWHLWLVLGTSSVAAALFWPALEADIGDHSPSPAALARRMGRFNIAWCSGLACMGVSLGYVGEQASQEAVLLAAAGFSLLTLPAHLWRRFEPEAAAAAAQTTSPNSASTGFWLGALLLNFAATGTNAAFRYHVPEVTGAGHSAAGGAFLSALFAAEVVVFVILGRRAGWRPGLGSLGFSALLVTLGAAVCGLSWHPVPFTLGCIMTGAGCGAIYNASLCCSVAAEHGRGHRGGVHEAAIGLGGGLLPFAGGLTAWFLGSGHAAAGMLLFLLPAAGMLLASLIAAPLLLAASRPAGRVAPSPENGRQPPCGTRAA